MFRKTKHVFSRSAGALTPGQRGATTAAMTNSNSKENPPKEAGPHWEDVCHGEV
jgi:hypothetical protein